MINVLNMLFGLLVGCPGGIAILIISSKIIGLKYGRDGDFSLENPKYSNTQFLSYFFVLIIFIWSLQMLRQKKDRLFLFLLGFACSASFVIFHIMDLHE